jgi:hypothetical protein
MRVAEAEKKRQRFSGFLEREIWWQSETFRFLNGRSPSISLHDYQTEKPLVDEVPHRVLLCTVARPEQRRAREAVKQVRKARRPRGSPFNMGKQDEPINCAVCTGSAQGPAVWLCEGHSRQII